MCPLTTKCATCVYTSPMHVTCVYARIFMRVLGSYFLSLPYTAPSTARGLNLTEVEIVALARHEPPSRSPTSMQH